MGTGAIEEIIGETIGVKTLGEIIGGGTMRSGMCMLSREPIFGGSSNLSLSGCIRIGRGGGVKGKICVLVIGTSSSRALFRQHLNWTLL